MPPRDPANPNNCAICNWDREEVRICQGESEFVTAQIFTCPQCGEYLLDSSGFRPWRKKGYVFLSCAARQSWEAGQPLLVKANTFTQVVQAHENTTVQGNLMRLLAYLGKKAGRPGHSVTINLDRDFTVIDSEDGAEFTAYLNLLSSDGLVTVEYGPSAGPRVNLLLAGWNRLQSGPQVGGKPGTCFVAMWFDPSLGEAFSLGIQAAIEQDCDMKAVRIDQ
jgi:hypothetical protein